MSLCESLGCVFLALCVSLCIFCVCVCAFVCNSSCPCVVVCLWLCVNVYLQCPCVCPCVYSIGMHVCVCVLYCFSLPVEWLGVLCVFLRCIVPGSVCLCVCMRVYACVWEHVCAYVYIAGASLSWSWQFDTTGPPCSHSLSPLTPGQQSHFPTATRPGHTLCVHPCVYVCFSQNLILGHRFRVCECVCVCAWCLWCVYRVGLCVVCYFCLC